MEKEGKFLFGLLTGIIIGGVLGLILAPESGEETRKKIQESTEKLKDAAEKIVNKVKKETSEFLEKGKDYISGPES